MWNQFLAVALSTWIAAQLLKMLIGWMLFGRLDLSRLLSSGGMPSAHSALVTSLAIAIARREGIASATFAVAAVFAAIVMFDAAGVRQAVGLQGRLLNNLVERHEDLIAQKTRELLGHTYLEVLGGILVGLIIALAWPSTLS